MTKLKSSNKSDLIYLAIELYNTDMFLSSESVVSAMPEDNLLEFHTKVAEIKAGSPVILDYNQVALKRYFTPVGYSIDADRVMKNTLRSVQELSTRKKLEFYQGRLVVDVEQLCLNILKRSKL